MDDYDITGMLKMVKICSVANSPVTYSVKLSSGSAKGDEIDEDGIIRIMERIKNVSDGLGVYKADSDVHLNFKEKVIDVTLYPKDAPKKRKKRGTVTKSANKNI